MQKTLEQNCKEATKYIDRFWKKLERFNPHDDETLIGLPHPYMIPNNKNGGHFSFDEMYYWDSYFVSLGLYGTDHEQFAFYFAENFISLLKRFGMIPNASRFYFTSRSQPPFLTSLIFDIYKNADFKNPKVSEIVSKYKSKSKWLQDHIELAKKEYAQVWMGEAQPHWRQVFNGLSRYYDINVLHGLAEAEGGWDMTPRYRRRCLDFIPIDLNSLLYKYESDFAQAAELSKDYEEAAEWRKRMEKRRLNITKYLWSEKDGFFFDYDYVNNKFSDAWSVAGFNPLWSGLATKEQAAAIVKNLKKFEFEGGVATCLESKHVGSKFGFAPPMQWDYPNGWAPLHWIVIQGLENYGYHEEAKRIAQKWLKNNLTNFEKTGAFWEKYNVVDPQKPAREGVYPQQKGFGWTNAVFLALSKKYPVQN